MLWMSKIYYYVEISIVVMADKTDATLSYHKLQKNFNLIHLF